MMLLLMMMMMMIMMMMMMIMIMMMTWHMPCHRCVENDMKVVHYEPAEGHSQGDLPKNSCKMMRG